MSKQEYRKVSLIMKDGSRFTLVPGLAIGQSLKDLEPIDVYDRMFYRVEAEERTGCGHFVKVEYDKVRNRYVAAEEVLQILVHGPANDEQPEGKAWLPHVILRRLKSFADDARRHSNSAFGLSKDGIVVSHLSQIATLLQAIVRDTEYLIEQQDNREDGPRQVERKPCKDIM